MAITKISDLKDKIATGARSNLFEVTLTDGFGIFNNDKETFSYLCKGAQLPGSTVGLIDVPFQGGRRYKLAGDRTFPDWTTTVINTPDQKLRQLIEQLQVKYGEINYESTKTKTNSGSLLSTVIVKQYDLAGTARYQYTLENCWPSDISTIDLSYDSVDTLEEFTVTWTYDYFTFSQLSSTSLQTLPTSG